MNSASPTLPDDAFSAGAVCPHADQHDKVQPNLFIIGAPKCGTTSLAYYLSGHPSIFMSRIKEPNYFARSLTVPGSYLSRQPWHVRQDAYLNLFSEATACQSIVGEASTRYLRCAEAIRIIRYRYPLAKFIVCIRHPVDLTASWHAQKLREGQECEASLEKAWELQDARMAGDHRSPGLQAIDALQYRQVASVGSQLESLLNNVSHDRVQIVVLDDLLTTPQAIYGDVLRFLGLKDDGRHTFPVLNDSCRAAHKNASALHRFLRGMAYPYRMARTFVGVPPQMSPRFRDTLMSAFEEEIDKLENIMCRSFACWRRVS